MAAKLSIIAGAVSQQTLEALVIAGGFGAEVPSVQLRAPGSPQGRALALERLQPAAVIAPALQARGVSVYRVQTPITGACVLEARSANGSLRRTTGTIRPLPARLTDAQAGLSFVLASCTYYWEPYVNMLAWRLPRAYGLGPAPSFSLFVGDNVYLDIPKPREQRPQDAVGRYLKYFLSERYAAGRAQLPSFTTYDDHEFWNDYPNRELPVSLWLTHDDSKVFGAAAHACLDLFQRSINPAAIVPGGRAYRIDIPPLSFFVADTRSDRKDAQTMSEADLRALEAWVAGLQGPGMLVLGQPLWIAPKNTAAAIATADHNIPFYKAQYNRICAALERSAWDVMVLSGDVHYSRLLRIAVPGNRIIPEVVSSPLISIPSIGTSLNDLLGIGDGTTPAGGAAIEDPVTVPRTGWRASYQLGTGLPASYAVLQVRAVGERVHVGLQFIDLRLAEPAPLVQRTNLGPARMFTNTPAGPKCSFGRVASLGRRLS